MVKALLKLKEIPRPDDAADAAAIAICHINTDGFNSRCKK
jgi:crossover junction endodeoxyribonuclease RuvC